MNAALLNQQKHQHRRVKQDCRHLNKSGQRRTYTESEYRELKIRVIGSEK